MEEVAITLQVPLAKILKVPDKSKLISSLIQRFKGNGIGEVTVKEIQYIDRRSFVSPGEGVVSVTVTLGVGAPTVQIIESLDSLIEDGRGSTKKLGITIGDKQLVDVEGNLIPDNDIVKLIWSMRNPAKSVEVVGTALAYGSVMYLAWSSDPIPIALTITNGNLIREVISGRKRSLVPQVRVKWFSCSICAEDIEECEHAIGEKYSDAICEAVPRDIQFLEDTVSDAVVDPRCRITDLLLIERDGTGCEWFAFQQVNVLERFKNINDARKDKLVQREAANKFRSYFSKHSVGRCKYGNGEGKTRARVTSRRKPGKV